MRLSEEQLEVIREYHTLDSSHDDIKALLDHISYQDKVLSQANEMAGFWLDYGSVKDYYMGCVSEQHVPELAAWLRSKGEKG